MNYGTFIAVFLAVAVECVEAATIVLAAGITRGWREASAGTVSALAILAAAVAVLGWAVIALPLRWLHLVVGVALLFYGLTWLRKAVLRAAGRKAKHDEAAIFSQQVAQAAPGSDGGTGPGDSGPGSPQRGAGRGIRELVASGTGFAIAFKGVLLEGTEVVVIIAGLGAASLSTAVFASACAVVLVTAAAFAIRAPLARVPENMVKFAVGILLTGFGVFWLGEGSGLHWPGSDAALLALIPVTALLAMAAVAILRPAAHETT